MLGHLAFSRRPHVPSIKIEFREERVEPETGLEKRFDLMHERR